MKKILLWSTLVLNLSQVEAINIKLLKGTHVVAPADYSPVMGLSFMDWDIAETWYRLSPKYQSEEFRNFLKAHPKQAKNVGQQKLAKDVLAKKNNGTQDLLMEMFHIAGGTFNVTNADGNPVKYLKPGHVGTILRVVKKWNDLVKSPTDLAKYKTDLTAEHVGLQKKSSSMNAEITQLKKQIGVETDEKKNAELIASLSKKEAEIRMVSEQQSYLASVIKIVDKPNFAYEALKLELINILKGLPIQASGKEWSKFADSIVRSLQETNEGQYPENTLQGLLLGFALAKSDTRDDLQDYFRGFLANESFVLPKDEYNYGEIDNILSASVQATDFEKCADLLSSYTYREKYASQLPKMVSNLIATYKGVEFVDCMDTTLRMLTNIVTYQKSDNKVGVVPAHITLNPAVQNFYEAKNGLCAQAGEVGNSEVHQAWAQVIENVHGCVYAQIGTGAGVHQHVSSFDGEGFIPVDHDFTATASGKVLINGASYEPYQLTIGGKSYPLAQKMIDGKKYILVPKSSELFCCEMRANMLNVVEGLNYVFNLDLHQKFEQIFEPNFIAQNFEKICQKFNWKPQDDITNLNITSSAIIPVTTTEGVFTINVHYNAHGYISVKSGDIKNVDLKIPETTTRAVTAAIVGIGMKEVLQLPDVLQELCLYKNCVKNDPLVKIKTILSYPGPLSEDIKQYVKSLIIDCCFNQNMALLPNLINESLKELMQAGLKDFIIDMIQLLNSLNINNFELFVLPFLINEKQLTLDQGLSLIEKSMNDADDNVRSSAMNSISDLIQKGLITAAQIDNIVPLIEKGMNDTSYTVRYLAMNNIRDLIEKDFITAAQIVSLIEKSMNDADDNVRSSAMNNIGFLIQKNLITAAQIDKIISLIEKSMNDADDRVRSSAMNSIRSLIETDLITAVQIDKIVPLIEKGMNDTYDNVRFSAMNNIGFLIQKDLITAAQINKIVPLIEKSMNDAYFTVRSSAMNNIGFLIKKGLITAAQIDKIISLIEKRMNNADSDVRYFAMKSIESLIQKDLITVAQIDKIVPLIEKSMNDAEDRVRFSAMKSIVYLIQKDLITAAQIDKIVPLIEKGMNDTYDNVRSSAMNSIEFLIQKDLITAAQIDQIVPLIEKSMNDTNANVRYFAMKSIESLIQKDLITAAQIDKIVPLIEKSMNDTYDNVRSLAMYNIGDLIQKDLITAAQIDQIVSLIEKSMNDTYSDVRSFAMNNIGDLIQKDLITAAQIDQIVPLIEKSMNDANDNVRYFAMKSIESLIQKDLITAAQIDKIIPLIKKSMNDSDNDVRSTAISVNQLLVEKQKIAHLKSKYMHLKPKKEAQGESLEHLKSYMPTGKEITIKQKDGFVPEEKGKHKLKYREHLHRSSAAQEGFEHVVVV